MTSADRGPGRLGIGHGTFVRWTVDSPSPKLCHGAVLSYQSARSGWKIILAVSFGCLIALPASARPYRDERRGFELDLPDEWRLAPAFGETDAMTFERPFSARRGRRTGTLSVRPIGIEIDDQRVQAELRKVWGPPSGPVHPLSPRLPRATLGWANGYRPAPEVRGQAFLFRFQATRFLITLRAAPRDLRRFRREAALLLQSFSPLRGPSTTTRVRRSTRPRPARDLTGHWVRDDGAALIFGSNGEYSLADLDGQYHWQDGLLVLSRADGGTSSFSVTRRGDSLGLSAPGLPAPLSFTRFRPRLALAGTWIATLEKGTLVLTLAKTGRFKLGAFEGDWSIDGRRLVLRKSATEIIAYAWQFSRNVLTLSGGDLDAPLRLTKRGR